jgi:CheY-like chemotaxis protein
MGPGADLNSYGGEKCVIEETMMVEMPGETIPATAFVEAQARGGLETILLVEDEGFLRKVAAEVLEAAGYQLVIARNGTEALDACRKSLQPIDLLLTDVVMPGMSGRELANKFEGLCPHARVLLMSGNAGQLAWDQLSPYRKAYLAKPFSVTVLLKKVREALDTNPFASEAFA